MAVGRPPTPTRLKMLAGERPDRINYNEPRPAQLPVEVPEGLSEAGRTVWDRYAPDLIRKGVLAYWDQEAFAGVVLVDCGLLAGRGRCRGPGDHSPGVGPAPAYGTTVLKTIKNPALQIVDVASEKRLKLAARFGLTPSDRARLAIELPGRPRRRDGSTLPGCSHDHQRGTGCSEHG